MATAELLTPPHNYAIVQLPGRRFPGIVFQGDSAFLLWKRLSEIAASIRSGEENAALDQLDDAIETLNGVVLGYERCLAARRMEPPYFREPNSGAAR